jgi:hypothetical protein
LVKRERVGILSDALSFRALVLSLDLGVLEGFRYRRSCTPSVGGDIIIILARWGERLRMRLGHS